MHSQSLFVKWFYLFFCTQLAFAFYFLCFQQNSFRRNWMLEQPLVFTGCSSIHFFNSLPFPKTVSQAVLGTLSLTVQHQCDLRDTIPLYCSPITSHPTLTGEAEGFPKAGKYPKHVTLPTYLDYLQPSSISWQVLFTCQGLLRNISLAFWLLYVASWIVPLGHGTF